MNSLRDFLKLFRRPARQQPSQGPAPTKPLKPRQTPGSKARKPDPETRARQLLDSFPKCC